MLEPLKCIAITANIICSRVSPIQIKADYHKQHTDVFLICGQCLVKADNIAVHYTLAAKPKAGSSMIKLDTTKRTEEATDVLVMPRLQKRAKFLLKPSQLLQLTLTTTTIYISQARHKPCPAPKAVHPGLHPLTVVSTMG